MIFRLSRPVSCKNQENGSGKQWSLHAPLNPLSVMWRINPSSKWSSQWPPHDGYIRHGWITSCVCWRDSATPECFRRGSQGTIFVPSSKLSLWLVSRGHWMMPMLWSGGRADKISNKLAGVVACLGGSMVEHQPRLLGSQVRFSAGAFAIFSVSAKASLPISLSPFLSLPLPFPFPLFDLWFALKNAYSHLSRSYVHFKEFTFVSRAFVRFSANCSSSGRWFRWCLGALFDNSAPSPGIFCELHFRPWVFFWKFPFFFSKQSRCYLPYSHGVPQAEQSTLLMVHRKLGQKLDFQALARSSAGGPSIVVTIGTSRMRWSMVQKRQKHIEVRVWLSEVSTLHQLQNKQVLWGLFPRPDVATVLHFAVFAYVNVRQQVGQAAAQGQRRKPVICDISSVGHRGVTNLSPPIWLTGRRHCTVFRHVMQLSLLVLC